MRRRDGVGRALLATLPALAMGVIATPNRAEAAVDCSAAALQNLKLPDPANPGADGWTSTGPALNAPASPPELAAGDQSEGTAQLFTQQVGNVLCLYLRRQHPAGDTLNGVLCFDTTDCSVCAWDLATPPPPDPKGTKFMNMLFTSSYGGAGSIQDCSSCHVSGPAMPMNAMYQQADLLDLMNTCVSHGGPQWVSAPAGWATQGAGNVIATTDVPATCGQAGCHTTGFLKPQANQTIWCGFAGQAFKDGGSMSGYSNKNCRTFMNKLGCDPDECGPALVAVPAVSNWGLASLTAFMIAAGCLVVRRKQSPHTA